MKQPSLNQLYTVAYIALDKYIAYIMKQPSLTQLYTVACMAGVERGGSGGLGRDRKGSFTFDLFVVFCDPLFAPTTQATYVLSFVFLDAGMIKKELLFSVRVFR